MTGWVNEMAGFIHAHDVLDLGLNEATRYPCFHNQYLVAVAYDLVQDPMPSEPFHPTALQPSDYYRTASGLVTTKPNLRHAD